VNKDDKEKGGNRIGVWIIEIGMKEWTEICERR